ncbi:MAG: glycosyltransferase [Calditrichaeota bacterium]|nr:MAG: glycosyltransferase [Calditrichota bacterium]
MPKKNKTEKTKSINTNFAKKAPGNARLSVCMIVKDEEKMLPECLESVHGLFDELIVVDTGSSDNTVAIAEKFGAVVYHHPWENNFSLHRNQSIEYATGDWILQIDADERLDLRSVSLLRETIENARDDVEGFCVVIQDYKKDGKQSVRFNYPRIFRNNVGVKYESAVHNQVIIKGKVDFSEIRINHFGYDLDPESMLKKFKRSVRLLRKEARENPDDPRAFYYLANAYSQYQRFDKAIIYAKKTLEILRKMPSAPPYYLSIYHGLIGGLIANKNLDEAREVCNEALQVRQDYVDVYFHLARINYMQKKFDATIEAGKKYLELAQFYNEDASRLEIINYYTLDRVYRINFWLGISFFAKNDSVRGMQFIEAGLAEKESDHANVLEMIHNSFAVAPYEIVKEIVQKTFDRYKESPAFFYFLIQELSSIDMLILLPQLVATLDADAAIRKDAFAHIIYHLSKEQSEHALKCAQEFDAFSEKKIHASLCEFVLQHSENKLMPVPKKLQDQFPLLGFIHLVNGVMSDEMSQIDMNQVDALQTNDNQSLELKMMAALLQLYNSIILNDVDNLVKNVVSLIQLADFSEDPVLEDIEDLKRILVDFIQKADRLLCPDAGDLAIKIAENFFSEDPVFMSFKYRREIIRAKRRGPYGFFLRLYFKYLILPKREWYSDKASQNFPHPKSDAPNALLQN